MREWERRAEATNILHNRLREYLRRLEGRTGVRWMNVGDIVLGKGTVTTRISATDGSGRTRKLHFSVLHLRWRWRGKE